LTSGRLGAKVSPGRFRNLPGGIAMEWVTPSFVEIEMSAEIGSYQDDFDGI
jgi:hypothetical protein